MIAPACHDTGSAVAAVATAGKAAFLSSGTWSLLGTEVAAPVMTPRALELNFTNEGGVCGTTRLLKNIGGLWLLQSCRRCWAEAGQRIFLRRTASGRSRRKALVHVADRSRPSLFPQPARHGCGHRRLTALKPNSPRPTRREPAPRLSSKASPSSTGVVLESLEELTGTGLEEIRIIGGGSKNRLLNQFTANATGRPVIAGPVEATALGNIAMQMLGTGAVASLADARAAIDRSFPTDRFEPVDTDQWNVQYKKFRALC